MGGEDVFERFRVVVVVEVRDRGPQRCVFGALFQDAPDLFTAYGGTGDRSGSTRVGVGDMPVMREEYSGGPIQMLSFSGLRGSRKSRRK